MALRSQDRLNTQNRFATSATPAGANHPHNSLRPNAPNPALGAPLGTDTTQVRVHRGGGVGGVPEYRFEGIVECNTLRRWVSSSYPAKEYVVVTTYLCCHRIHIHTYVCTY